MRLLCKTAQLLKSPYIPLQQEVLKLYRSPGVRRPKAKDVLSDSYYFFGKGGLSYDLALLCAI